MAKRSLLQTPVYELAGYKAFVQGWRERFTDVGRRAVVTMVLLGVLALDTRRNQTFLLFAIAVGLHVAAVLVVRLGRPKAQLFLAVPPRATVGEAVAIRGRVLVAEGDGALLRTTFGQRFDPRRLSIEPDEQVVVADSGAELAVRFTLKAARRGRYELGRATLRPLDPLGFVAGDKLDATKGGHVVLVAPPIFPFELDGGVLGRRHQLGGAPLGNSTSDSLELVGTREWRPGDRLRNVHWRSFARLGVPVVKEFHEEYFPRVAIVLDTQLPARITVTDRAAFEASLSVGGSIAARLAEQEQAVELLAAGPELYRVAVGRGLGQLEAVLDVLACVEPAPPTSGALAELCAALEPELARIATFYVVLLDWDDERAALVEHLRAAGAEVHVVLVREGPTTGPVAAPEDLTRMTPSDVQRAIAGAR